MSRYESVYENQRYARAPSGERHWRATTSTPPEPPPWSDPSGTRAIEHDIMCAPAGCHWTGNWSIDYSGDKDRMGFEYATKFERFAISGRTNRGLQKWSDKYRRRLWVRPHALNNDEDGSDNAALTGGSDGAGAAVDSTAAQTLDRTHGAAAPAPPATPADSDCAQHSATVSAPVASSSSGGGATTKPAGRTSAKPALPAMTRQQIVDGMSAVQSHLGVLEAHARLIGGPRDSQALRQQLQVARNALRSRLSAAIATITQLQEAQGGDKSNGNGDSPAGSPGEVRNESSSFSRAEWNKLRREMDKLQQRFERCDREARVMERQFPHPAAVDDGADASRDISSNGSGISDGSGNTSRRMSKGGPGRLQAMRSNSLKDLGNLGAVKRSDATGLRDAPEGSIVSQAGEPPAAPGGQTWSATTAAAESTADAQACAAGASGNDVARGTFVPRDAAGELLLAQMRPESHVQVNAHLIQERGAAIEEVATSIREVNALFKEMATHVSDQQEDIDKLEEQMMSANLLVREGVTQIEDAHDHQPECIVM